MTILPVSTTIIVENIKIWNNFSAQSMTNTAHGSFLHSFPTSSLFGPIKSTQYYLITLDTMLIHDSGLNPLFGVGVIRNYNIYDLDTNIFYDETLRKRGQSYHSLGSGMYTNTLITQSQGIIKTKPTALILNCHIKYEYFGGATISTYHSKVNVKVELIDKVVADTSMYEYTVL